MSRVKVPSEAILVFEGHAVARAIQTLVVCTAPRGYGDIRAQAAAKDRVWVCGPTTAGGSVDVCGHKSGQGPHLVEMSRPSPQA